MNLAKKLTVGTAAAAAFSVFLFAQSALHSQNAGELSEGERLYRSACAACHGERGDGKGEMARYLSPQPRDFTVNGYKFRSTPSGSLPTDADLIRTISRGVPGTMMPAWEKVFSAQEMLSLVRYIKTFLPDFATDSSSEIIAIPPPPRTGKLLEEGLHIYQILRCWSCHGKTGKGDGPAALLMKDEKGRPIKPHNFSSGVWKGGGRVEDVYRSFATGLNGTPMPSSYYMFYFAQEDIDTFDPYKEIYDSAEVEALRLYVKALPTRDSLARLSPEAEQNLFEERRWQLAYYVFSLGRSSLWKSLFTENVEKTR
jgi:cytochrome c oxidase cbb3-type subunit 2